MFYFGLCVCHFIQKLLSTWAIKCVLVNFLILLTFCSTEIICPDPPSLSNTVRVSSGYNGVGSTILYACENGSRFIGGSSTKVLTCPDTAQWTGINSSCQMKSVFVILRFPYDMKLYKYIPSCNLNLTQANTKPRCSFVTLRMIT